MSECLLIVVNDGYPYLPLALATRCVVGSLSGDRRWQDSGRMLIDESGIAAVRA